MRDLLNRLQDPELWLSDGDCLVHFYERGFSRRGASLRISLADLESSNCRHLLEQCFMHASPDSSPSSDTPSEKSECFNDPSTVPKFELYIPAPAHLSREEALQYHLGTRNFFAWVYEKPMVGDRLGQALVALLERMNHYRSNQDENQDDLLAYIDDQGYTDFRDCPDHALAVLQFAEKFEYRELWTDAFVHCTGMNDRLDSSAEFEVSFCTHNIPAGRLLTPLAGRLSRLSSPYHASLHRDGSTPRTCRKISRSFSRGRPFRGIFGARKGSRIALGTVPIILTFLLRWTAQLLATRPYRST